jgi:hypothetical protein
LGIEVNFGKFISVNCILYVGLVENFKSSFGICLVEQVARARNRKTIV